MKLARHILVALTLFPALFANGQHTNVPSIGFSFYGDTVYCKPLHNAIVQFEGTLSQEAIEDFYISMESSGLQPVVEMLQSYKATHNPDDWMYYQLVRRTAQQLSPKEVNYHRYTLYKWYFLNKTGYDAVLNIAGNQLLFYVQCNERIYDIPFHNRNGKQYVCLNYHDYGSIDFNVTKFQPVVISYPEAKQAFSYRLTRMPEFRSEDYEEKELAFNYQDVNYQFRIKLNTKVKNIFANYPVADYELYFNTPLSSETYKSLIPQLRQTIGTMSTREGVAYLMRFTRYAFLYQPDVANFGKEKRLLPEQTLLYDGSDCEDRAALFFCLVKELYNLPMIVLAYPEHVSIAVKFDKPIGQPIMYNGQRYTLCEPTPQAKDFPMGKIPPSLLGQQYEVAYAYQPQ